MRGFERFGAVKAILITAFLFGLMHIDFQKFMGTFLLGGLIGFLVYRSNSIFTGIFAHFANNTISVIMTYAALKMGEKGMGDVGADKAGDAFAQLESLPQAQLIAFIVVWGVLFVFSAICFSILIYAFIRNTSNSTDALPREEKRFSVKSLTGLLPGILLIVFMYVMRGLELKNVIEPEIIKGIYSAMGLM
jgi:membrane protease YdiL (CAAX protease family)